MLHPRTMSRYHTYMDDGTPLVTPFYEISHITGPQRLAFGRIIYSVRFSHSTLLET